MQGPGPDGLIVQVQRGLGVLELEVEQGLVPVQVEAEGDALAPLGSSVAQEPRALRHYSSFSRHSNWPIELEMKVHMKFRNPFLVESAY